MRSTRKIRILIAKPHIDDLNSHVPKTPGDHLGSAVVSVQSRLANEYLDGLARHRVTF